ncbi:hypothetical protein BRD17_00530 [Halobacteriales archaeon SW_7_68_16]|nr:MAG: hypothetical protein BRD17_00530 [Halobacteriales archaeon SW_7_68_16]
MDRRPELSRTVPSRNGPGFRLACAVHALFGASLAGSIRSVTDAVLPAARAGEIDAAPFGSVVDRAIVVSRTVALVVPPTGGYRVLRVSPGEACSNRHAGTSSPV